MTLSSAVPGWSAVEDREDEVAIDRAALHRLELIEFLAAFDQRGRPFPGPDISVQGKFRDAFRMALGEGGGAQSARGNAVDVEALRARRLHDVGRGGTQVIGAIGDVGGDVAMLVGATVALHIDAPGVVALRHEPIHNRGERTSGHLKIEGRPAPPSTSRARKSIVPFGVVSGALFQRNRFTSPFLVQCSVPGNAACASGCAIFVSSSAAMSRYSNCDQYLVESVFIGCPMSGL